MAVLGPFWWHVCILLRPQKLRKLLSWPKKTLGNAQGALEPPMTLVAVAPEARSLSLHSLAPRAFPAGDSSLLQAPTETCLWGPLRNILSIL